MEKEKALIIGSGKMGLATAKSLIEDNFEVIISGRNEVELIAAANKLGRQASHFVADASVNEELENMLSKLQQLNHIIVTVSSNAPASGINTTTDTIARQTFERFWISYNVLHFAPKYLEKNGSVTLISGSSGKTPLKGYGVWGTLHGSINALVKQASIDIAPIRVNAISPGGIGLMADRQLTEYHPQAEDIAEMIVAVIKNKAVTSALIDVDGGERQGTWSE